MVLHLSYTRTVNENTEMKMCDFKISYFDKKQTYSPTFISHAFVGDWRSYVRLVSFHFVNLKRSCGYLTKG